MMHRCSNGNMTATCTCFSMLLSTPAPADMCSVDCTLSLGTPSTRLLSNDDEKRRRSGCSFCMNNFSSWNVLTKVTPPVAVGDNSLLTDPLLARRCSNCDTTSTPLWRNGPRGPKSLCNACGIRFKKEEKRSTVTIATTAATPAGTGGVHVMEAQQMLNHYNYTWVHHHSQSQKMGCFSPAKIRSEFRFLDDDINGDSDTGISFRSWSFNVTDRPSIVHGFTR